MSDAIQVNISDSTFVVLAMESCGIVVLEEFFK